MVTATCNNLEEIQAHFADDRFATLNGCRIVEAVKDGTIAPSRHASYRELYTTLKEKKRWK
jgi:putative ribosome biogenesis GTPase RsgA